MSRKGIKVVGAIDLNKDYLGSDVGAIVGLGRQLGVKITDDVKSVLKDVQADIITDCTATYLDKLVPAFGLFLDAGLNVASIAEELAYPWIRYPEIAKELDERAKKNNVTILGS